jgi:hypothetical protein
MQWWARRDLNPKPRDYEFSGNRREGAASPLKKNAYKYKPPARKENAPPQILLDLAEPD